MADKGGDGPPRGGGLIVPRQRPAMDVPPRTIVARFDEDWEIAMAHHPGVSPFRLIVAGGALEHWSAELITAGAGEREVVVAFSEDWELARVSAHADVPRAYLVALGRFMVMRGEFLLDMAWAREWQVSAMAQAQSASVLDQIKRQGGMRAQ